MLQQILRFRVDQIDQSTFTVVDSYSNSEFCVCADYSTESNVMPAKKRAILISASLNSDWDKGRKTLLMRHAQLKFSSPEA